MRNDSVANWTHPHKLSVVGRRFGRWFVLADAKRVRYPSGQFARRCLCRCDCGRVAIVNQGTLVSGKSQSCGCLNRETTLKALTTHGMVHTRVYRIWVGMKARCLNPRSCSFENYGGRGITICDKWLSFAGFYEDMGPTYHDGLTIDRIDNSLGYYKENCRWATHAQQNCNKRDNQTVTFQGETKTVSQWSDYLGIPYRTLAYRVKHWPLERALTEPVHSKPSPSV
jgi:hypothetical protein